MTAAPADILIIDDEAVIHDGCKLALCEHGHTVDAVFDGRNGIERLTQRHFDLVLLDLKLPDIDGLQLLEVIRREKP